MARIRSYVSAPVLDVDPERTLGEFRAVVLLVDVEELSYEEAAAALNCPLGTLRSRLCRARKLLYLELQSYARMMGYFKRSAE